MSFDPSSDPDFEGGLSVDVVGYGIDRRIMFRSRVDAKVQSRPKGGALASTNVVTNTEERP